MRYDAHVMQLEPGESASVQVLGDGYFRVQLVLNEDQWTYLDFTRSQLEQLNTNIHAALLESSSL